MSLTCHKSASAKGNAGSKVILLGEHAVVHGTDALVLGLKKGITVTATQNIALQIKIVGWETAEKNSNYLLHNALHQLLGSLRVSNQVSFHVNAAIPAQAGMGASASLGLACARAISKLFGLECTKQQLYEAVLKFETVFHHNPSGVDIYAVQNEGCALFNMHSGLNVLPYAPPPIMVVHSGAPGATKETVQKFRDKLHSDIKGPDNLQSISHLVAQSVHPLAQRNWKELGTLMSKNHQLLDWFGVSTHALNHICTLAHAHGAWGAKLTGGGGGGCAIVLIEPEKQQQLSTDLNKNGYHVIL